MPFSSNFSFHFVEIRPGEFRYGKLISELTTAVFRVGRRMKSDYDKTVSTWAVKPVFEMLTQRTSSIVSVLVGTDNRIYAYVNSGTAIRFATMDHNFEPKSKINVIGSFPGRGGRLFVSRLNPHRGIAGRNWSEVIERKYQKDFVESMDKAMDAAAKASGHAM